MSNLPDDFNHAAWAARYERPEIDPDDASHTAAALYWLTEYLDGVGDEDALMSAIRDCVSDMRLHEDLEDQAEDELYRILKSLYAEQPDQCLRSLGMEVAYRAAKPVVALEKFIRRVMRS